MNRLRVYGDVRTLSEKMNAQFDRYIRKDFNEPDWDINKESMEKHHSDRLEWEKHRRVVKPILGSPSFKIFSNLGLKSLFERSLTREDSLPKDSVAYALLEQSAHTGRIDLLFQDLEPVYSRFIINNISLEEIGLVHIFDPERMYRILHREEKPFSSFIPESLRLMEVSTVLGEVCSEELKEAIEYFVEKSTRS